jgi:phage anti-repressor protein
VYTLFTVCPIYQHFDGVIHKIDDSDNQLDGFTDYILENYKFKNNDYHILMTESSWDDSIDGKTYRDSHFSIASDNSETVAAHELGHMLGAKHNSKSAFSISIVYLKFGLTGSL